MRQVIERLTSEGWATARSDGSRHRLFPVAVSAGEGEAIRRWVVAERAERTIEVGLGYGISALYACLGLLENGHPGATHLALDPHQATRFAGCALQFIDEAGLGEMVEHVAEESQLALPRLVAEGRRFDLAIVDGNHRFEAVLVDLYFLGRLVRPGGVVFLDDYQLPGIAKAAAFFASNVGWKLQEVSAPDERHQWAVMRTSAGLDRRSYEQFVDF